MLLLAALCTALAVFAQQRPAPVGNHVVIITLDGFPGWALEDAYLPVPNLRRLAANGALAAGMRPVNPTVTWPNHTSLVTGVTPAKHGVLFNGTLVRDLGVPPRVEPWRDKKDMVHAPTLYDLVHDRGMTAAQVDWVAILNAPSIDWEFPERPERPETKPGVVREMVNGRTIVSEGRRRLRQPEHRLARRRVDGRSGSHSPQHRPEPAALPSAALDSIQHRYGPRTPAAMITMARSTHRLAAPEDDRRCRHDGERRRCSSLSDHGFKAVKQHVLPNVR